ncbi:MAG: ribonuclease HII [Rhizobiales bacterium]|nr:ribonuclease HII [Hyphomicrobiales bacterium]
MRQSFPTYLIETDLRQAGFLRIAGVDEVGRGPIAGPVVAAAVILDPLDIPDGLDDSKKLTRAKREDLFPLIMSRARVSVASLPSASIDRLNIRAATLLAMTRAVAGLSVPADHVLIDGRDIPSGIGAPATALVGGDGRSLSIAAASIVAKVIRDRMMAFADQHYPGYDFARHKGYGSALHRAAVAALAPSALHRQSFEPIKSMTGFEKPKSPGTTGAFEC